MISLVTYDAEPQYRWLARLDFRPYRTRYPLVLRTTWTRAIRFRPSLLAVSLPSTSLNALLLDAGVAAIRIRAVPVARCRCRGVGIFERLTGIGLAALRAFRRPVRPIRRRMELVVRSIAQLGNYYTGRLGITRAAPPRRLALTGRWHRKRAQHVARVGIRRAEPNSARWWRPLARPTTPPFQLPPRSRYRLSQQQLQAEPLKTKETPRPGTSVWASRQALDTERDGSSTKRGVLKVITPTARTRGYTPATSSNRQSFRPALRSRLQSEPVYEHPLWITRSTPITFRVGEHANQNPC